MVNFFKLGLLCGTYGVTTVAQSSYHTEFMPQGLVTRELQIMVCMSWFTEIIFDLTFEALPHVMGLENSMVSLSEGIHKTDKTNRNHPNHLKAGYNKPISIHSNTEQISLDNTKGVPCQ